MPRRGTLVISQTRILDGRLNLILFKGMQILILLVGRFMEAILLVSNIM